MLGQGTVAQVCLKYQHKEAEGGEFWFKATLTT
jgi:hypothetical protein